MSETDESRLWFAVLIQVGEDLAGPVPPASSPRFEYRQDAAEWLESSDNSVGSFLWTCDMLGFDVSLHRGLDRPHFHFCLLVRHYPH